MSSKIKISLAWQMMIGLALGIVVGALVDSSFAQTWLQPLGDLFIRLIRMVVVPLVLATIIAGAAGISDTSKLGRVAVKVLLVYAVTTGIAVACGLRDVMSELDGDVVLFAVPAEEYVEIDWRNAQRDEGRLKYLGGKQQLIAEGAFEDIDMAVRTIRKDTPSDEEMRHAGKVMTELDGTELFSRITESLTDEAMSERLAKAMSVFVDTVNMTVTQQKEKVFVIPDNIEEFDFRNYV